MKKLPKNFRWIEERFQEVMAAHQQLGKAVRAAGPLDAKSAELIGLAASATRGSEGAVHSHVRRARKAGASDEEIYHCLVLLTSTIGFPAVAAAISWAREILATDE
ncbi:MAG: carboxymuconolactone decarboxylase family protein [Thermodesulfobacteriota bacterium]